MTNYVKIGVVILLCVGLSGCIEVTCDDGSKAKDELGNEVRAKDWKEVPILAERYCAPTKTVPTLPVVAKITPPGPTPTNIAPAIGGVVLGALALGGAGNSQNSATSTTSTR